MRDKLIAGWALFRKSNWLLTAVVAALLLLGVLFVYSACYISEEHEVKPLYLKQLLWVAMGAFCYVSFAIMDFHQLKKYMWGIYVGSLALLVMVLLFGQTIYGARRWLLFFGNLISIQPSEFAKLSTIVLLAGRLGDPGVQVHRPAEIVRTLLLMALPAGLIMMQPDLGTAMVFVPASLVLMFVAGVPFRYVGGLVGAGVCMVAFVLTTMYLPAKLGAGEPLQERIASMSGLTDYQRGRIEVFFNPAKDPLGAGWNKRQSEIAVGSGGLRGKGYLRGIQNILGFLPRSVAPTDFIYSVIAEETGFMGSVVVLLLFSSVITLGMLIALRTLDPFGRLLCAGVTVMFFFHVFINVAMTVGLRGVVYDRYDVVARHHAKCVYPV